MDSEKVPVLLRPTLLISAVVLAVALLAYGAFHQPLPSLNASANRLVHRTLPELEQHAFSIVVAKATSSFLQREHRQTFQQDGSIQDFYTLTPVVIQRVLKDTSSTLEKGNRLKIVEPISVVGTGWKRGIWTTEGYVALQENTPYLLFLARNGSGQLGILNGNQGRFRLDDTQDALPNWDREEHQKLFTAIRQAYPELQQAAQ